MRKTPLALAKYLKNDEVACYTIPTFLEATDTHTFTRGRGEKGLQAGASITCDHTSISHLVASTTTQRER